MYTSTYILFFELFVQFATPCNSTHSRYAPLIDEPPIPFSSSHTANTLFAFQCRLYLFIESNNLSLLPRSLRRHNTMRYLAPSRKQMQTVSFMISALYCKRVFCKFVPHLLPRCTKIDIVQPNKKTQNHTRNKSSKTIEIQFYSLPASLPTIASTTTMFPLPNTNLHQQ